MSDSVKYIKYNGGVEASAFTKTNGTANDVLLADGTTIALSDLLSSYYTKDEADMLHTSVIKIKGTIGGKDGSISTLPTYAEVGDAYIVDSEADPSYEGHSVESGDIFVWIKRGDIGYWTVIQSNWTASSGSPDLSWGSNKTLATVGGVDINAKLPTNPIDELEIGGRNLLQKTEQDKYFSNWGVWQSEIDIYNGWVRVIQNSGSTTVGVITPKLSDGAILENGGKYILSFDCYLDSSSSVESRALDYCYLIFNSGGNYFIASNAIATKTSKRISIAFTFNRNRTENFGAMIGITGSNAPVFYVRNIQLEQGTKATDWTPAPEDVDAAINSKLSLSGGTMQGSINFWNEYNTIYGNGSDLNLSAHSNINIDALELHTYNILPQNETTNIGSSTSVFNNIYAKQFVKSGSSNDYVLLAGGGTELLSEITPDLSGYLKLSGGAITGAILPLVSAPTIGQAGSILSQYVSLGSTNNYFNTVYARLFKGLADNALRLYTYNYGDSLLLEPSAINLGNLDKPVYFKEGVPVICNSIENVKQLNTNASVEYPLLCKFDATSNSVTNYVNFASGVTLNPQSQTITTSKLNITNIGDSENNFYLNVSKPVTNKSLVIGTVSAGTTNLYINRSGIQAWNSTSDIPLDSGIPSMYLQGAGGNVICGGQVQAKAFYETSDIRKKEIKYDLSLSKCYDLIDKCQTVIYSLKDLTKEQVGMIAQEIEEFFPEVVATDEEGFKSLAYDRLVVICFKVLKDVIKRLEKLES